MNIEEEIRRLIPLVKETNQRLEKLENEVAEGFGKVNQRFEKFEEEVAEGFGKVDQRFNGIEEYLELVDGKLEGISVKVEFLDEFREKVEGR